MFSFAAAASLGMEVMGKFRVETEEVTWDGRDAAYLLFAMLLNIAVAIAPKRSRVVPARPAATPLFLYRQFLRRKRLSENGKWGTNMSFWFSRPKQIITMVTSCEGATEVATITMRMMDRIGVSIVEVERVPTAAVWTITQNTICHRWCPIF